MIDIEIPELKAKLDAKEDFLFIDVREPFEYAEYNLGAKLIPLGSLPGSLNELEPFKEKEIIIHCRSGARSGTAKNMLVELGYKNVRNVLGGILEWQRLYVNP